MDSEQGTCPLTAERIRAVIDRAHAAINRANALTSEVHHLQRAAEDQHDQARAALRDALELDEVGLSRATYAWIAGRPMGQMPADRAEAVLRRSAAITQATESRSDIDGGDSSAAISALRPEPAASGRSHQDVLADAHAGTMAARQIPGRPLHVMDSRTAAIRQQYTDNVTATASLQRRQLRLRASQMRALRCLLAAEPQLAGYSAMDSMVQQAVLLLNTALMHVELAERVLSGWEATETLPLIITRADDRAEAAAAVARDLLHSLHRGVKTYPSTKEDILLHAYFEPVGRQHNDAHSPVLQLQPKVLGATAGQIERLQCHMLDAAGVELLANSCSICLCSFAVGDHVRSMPCTHVHHKDCLDEWLAIKATCPLCQQELVLES